MTPSVYTRKKYACVLGKRMAYVERGEGHPVVFLHGNPTSSYLWRDILPHLDGLGRLIAPDLIGMGDSDKLDDPGPDSYSFAEHREYLWELLEQLQVRRQVVLVVHDWGSALGFDWANRHRERIAGIAHMESLVAPMEWADFGDAAEFFRAFRSPAGEQIVLEHNGFIEKMLPGATLAELSSETMDAYRAPFRNAGEDRRPMLSWPREIPIAGQPDDVAKIFEDYGAWLAESPVPKLFVNADPGGTVTGRIRDLVRTWPNQTEITVPGIHYVQEDSAPLIGPALARFVRALGR